MTDLDDRNRSTMARSANSASEPPPSLTRDDLRPLDGPRSRAWTLAVATVGMGLIAAGVVMSAAIHTGKRRLTTSAAPGAAAPAPASPTTTATPPGPIRMTAGQVPQALAPVTGVHPVLFPAGAPADWAATVQISSNAYQLKYRGPAGQTLSLAVSIPNPAPPGPTSLQRNYAFRGDRGAVYQDQDRADPNSLQWLIWNEPGSWAGDPAIANAARPDNVPYFMFATGMTANQFWQLAGSLRSTTADPTATTAMAPDAVR